MKLLLLALFLIAQPVSGDALNEESVSFSGVKFRVVKVDPKQVMLVWKDPAGKPFRTFDRVQAHHQARGKKVSFLMNAGIFEPGGIPSGLHLENGALLRKLNLAEGKGNFFLKPNGVLAWNGNKAFIGTPDSWQKLQGDLAAGSAIQSGPILLDGGRRHPAFREASPNKLHRNGVGLEVSTNKLVFAITAPAENVNLWDFAGLFLRLGCKDALFLDGVISQMALNPDRIVESNQFGAIFVVVE